MVTSCRVPYTHPPHCDVTIADSLGDTYIVFHVVFILLCFVAALLVWVLSIQVYRYKGIKRPYTVQVRIFFFLNVLSASLLLRSIDPFGWRALLPIWFAKLWLDVGSACLYSALFTVVYDWIHITLIFSLQKQALLYVGPVFQAFHLITWFNFIIFGLLQSTLYQTWVWHSLKLGLAAVTLLAVFGCMVYYGWGIYTTLRRSEASLAAATSSQGKVRTGSDESQRGTIGGVGASGKGGETMNRGMRTTFRSARKRTQKINRILQLMAVTSVLVLASVVIQSSYVAGNFGSKQNLDDHAADPTDMSDLVQEASFDIIHILAVYLCCFFFHQTGTETQQQQRANQLEVSRDASYRRKPAFNRRTAKSGSSESNNVI